MRLNSRAVDALNTVVVPVAGGGFAAVWFGEISLGEGEDFTLKVLRARLFSPAGRPLGPDFDVNTIRPGEGETVPALNPQFQVAAAPGGGFAVSWALGQTIYLRAFDAAGHAAAPEVPAITAEGAYRPGVDGIRRPGESGAALGPVPRRLRSAASSSSTRTARPWDRRRT